METLGSSSFAVDTVEAISQLYRSDVFNPLEKSGGVDGGAGFQCSNDVLRGQFELGKSWLNVQKVGAAPFI